MAFYTNEQFLRIFAGLAKGMLFFRYQAYSDNKGQEKILKRVGALEFIGLRRFWHKVKIAAMAM